VRGLKIHPRDFSSRVGTTPHDTASDRRIGKVGSVYAASVSLNVPTTRVLTAHVSALASKTNWHQ